MLRQRNALVTPGIESYDSTYSPGKTKNKEQNQPTNQPDKKTQDACIHTKYGAHNFKIYLPLPCPQVEKSYFQDYVQNICKCTWLTGEWVLLG